VQPFLSALDRTHDDPGARPSSTPRSVRRQTAPQSAARPPGSRPTPQHGDAPAGGVQTTRRQRARQLDQRPIDAEEEVARRASPARRRRLHCVRGVSGHSTVSPCPSSQHRPSRRVLSAPTVSPYTYTSSPSSFIRINKKKYAGHRGCLLNSTSECPKSKN